MVAKAGNDPQIIRPATAGSPQTTVLAPGTQVVDETKAHGNFKKPGAAAIVPSSGKPIDGTAHANELLNGILEKARLREPLEPKQTIGLINLTHDKGPIGQRAKDVQTFFEKVSSTKFEASDNFFDYLSAYQNLALAQALGTPATPQDIAAFNKTREGIPNELIKFAPPKLVSEIPIEKSPRLDAFRARLTSSIQNAGENVEMQMKSFDQLLRTYLPSNSIFRDTPSDALK